MYYYLEHNKTLKHNCFQVEFERASLLYKPLTTSMASRFVSAGTSEDAAKVEKEAELRTNDSIKAAKLKLFGKLTREKIEWHPVKLLCIRYIRFVE